MYLWHKQRSSVCQHKPNSMIAKLALVFSHTFIFVHPSRRTPISSFVFNVLFPDHTSFQYLCIMCVCVCAHCRLVCRCLSIYLRYRHSLDLSLPVYICPCPVVQLPPRVTIRLHLKIRINFMLSPVQQYQVYQCSSVRSIPGLSYLLTS